MIKRDRFALIDFGLAKEKAVHRILNAAIDSVDPYMAVTNSMLMEGDKLLILQSGKVEAEFNLGDFHKVYLVGLGKAAGPMVHAAWDLLCHYQCAGLVVNKQLYKKLPKEIHQVQGSHPVPDLLSIKAGAALRDFLQGSQPDDLVLFFISGGGSALAALPAGEISLEDLQTLTNSLLRSGAGIGEINTIRKQIDLVKGGGLARMAGTTHMATLVLSDVIGNPLDVIASGPTLPSIHAPEDGLKVLEKYGLLDQTPLSIINYLQSTQKKPTTSSKSSVPHIIIGDNDIAIRAAAMTALKEGFSVCVLPGKYTGLVDKVASDFFKMVREEQEKQFNPVPLCVIWGGEPVVKLVGSGKGGRNQHLALLLGKMVSPKIGECFISLATDGDDGPTDSAGAYVNWKTNQLADHLGLNMTRFIQENDSYSFFERTGQLLPIGPTGTNVNDLLFYFFTE